VFRRKGWSQLLNFRMVVRIFTLHNIRKINNWTSTDNSKRLCTWRSYLVLVLEQEPKGCILLENRSRGIESHFETWVYVCVFYIHVLFCVDSGPPKGRSPFQGVLHIVYKEYSESGRTVVTGSQWSDMPYKKKLQFLSWLFNNALIVEAMV
jgi:hypothetical protein